MAGAWILFPALIAQHFGVQAGDEARCTWARRAKGCIISFYRAGQPLRAVESGSANAGPIWRMKRGKGRLVNGLSRKSAR